MWVYNTNSIYSCNEWWYLEKYRMNSNSSNPDNEIPTVKRRAFYPDLRTIREFGLSDKDTEHWKKERDRNLNYID